MRYDEHPSGPHGPLLPTVEASGPGKQRAEAGEDEKVAVGTETQPVGSRRGIGKYRQSWRHNWELMPPISCQVEVWLAALHFQINCIHLLHIIYALRSYL